MDDERVLFRRCASEGYCTMNPTIGGWLQAAFRGDSSGGPVMKRNVMKLKKMIEWLMPESTSLLAKHHTAGADAVLHRLLYLKLCDLAASAKNSAS